MAVPVRVAGELIIRVEDLPASLAAEIRAALTFPNEERIKALEVRRFGAWDMPETVSLWREESRRGGERVLCLPRGFARSLSAGMADAGQEIEWVDERSRVMAAPGYWRPMLLRGYQAEAAAAMLTAEQGVYVCPAGGGKTIAMLGTAALAGMRTLWITDKAYLADQTRERAAAEYLDKACTVRGLGLSLDLSHPRAIGMIGQNTWEERDFTVALRQSLWSRKWELDPTGWWSQWGAVIVDEVHHASGETLGELCRAVPAAIFLGGSATPAKSEIRGMIVFSLVGPVIHETPRERLYAEGILMKPSVKRYNTGFEADFWPDHDSSLDDNGQVTCLVPGCPKSKKGQQHSHRNNYSSVLKKLVESKERNELIADEIVSERGHVHLIYSRQLKHLDLLRKACEAAGWDGQIFYIRGEENATGQAQQIAKAIQAGGRWKFVPDDKSKKSGTWEQVEKAIDGKREALVFSTVAEEGMDIPPMDRVHLVFPGKQDAATVQIIGRVERVADGKEDAVVKDYHDPVSVFQGHANDRYRVYVAQGYEVEDVVRATEVVGIVDV